MAAEIREITDSNHDQLKCYLDHILTDLHSALEKLERVGVLTEKHDRLLEEFRPIIDRFRSPAAAYITSRAQRKDRAVVHLVNTGNSDGYKPACGATIGTGTGNPANVTCPTCQIMRTP